MRPEKRVEEAQQRRKRIDRIYEHLDDTLALVTDDDDLQDDILNWMEDADDVPASSVLERVESKLAEFETKHEMYAVDVDGERNFPDDCEDCEHYGIACPALTKRSERVERERLKEDLRGASEEKVKQELRRYGGRLGCVVIIDLINEWEDDFEGLLERGQKYRRQTIHHIRSADDSARADAEIGETVAEKGGSR
jgi:hypothetical protein